MPQILVFGDSTAYGAWDKEGGWAERMKIFTNKKAISSGLKFYCVVYNLAIDGDTTSGVIKRFENETKERIQEEEIIIIFAIGINDSCFIKNTEEFLTPADKFENNIQQLVSCAQKLASKIIFVGLTPVEEIKTNPFPWNNTGKCYKNKDIQKYDYTIKSICQKNKIHFIEIFENFKKADYKNLLEDGLHPNSEGHKMIFEIVKDYLTKNKII